MAQGLEDIDPHEVSLVKRGANRRLFFLAKADGELDTDVAEFLAVPVAKEAALLDAVRETGGDETVEKAAAAFARSGAALVEAYGDSVPEQLLKAMQAAAGDEPADDEALDPAADNDDPADADDAVAKAEEPVYKRSFTAEQRHALAAKGHALPDGSYPIETKADLGPALTLARSGHGDVTKARALITRRANELGAADQLPDDWKVNKEDDVMTETAQAVPVRKEDGSWDLSAVPEENRPAFEAVIKAQDDEIAELRKTAETEASKADEAIKIAKAEKDHRETREYIQKAALLDKLSQTPDEFGPVLKEIAKAEEDGHITAGSFEKLDTVLKAANEAVEKGALFAEQGRTGHSDGHGDKVEAAAQEIRKADPSLTDHQAVAKALQNDPSLYDDNIKAVA